MEIITVLCCTKKAGEFMSVYGVDYMNGEDIDFLIVDADSDDEARKEAGKLLNAQGLPKRNIINLEKLDWLDK